MKVHFPMHMEPPDQCICPQERRGEEKRGGGKGEKHHIKMEFFVPAEEEPHTPNE